jgi:predicted site-specific integrase-resolvase
MLSITPESLLTLAQEQGKIACQKAKGGERKFTLVKRDEVLDLKKKWEEGVSISEAAEDLGTSPKIIRQLIRKKKLRAVRGLEEDGSHTWLINYDSLQILMLQLRLQTRRLEPGKMIPIITASQILSAYRIKMARIIDSILSGELRAYWAKEAERLDEILILQADVNLMLNDLSARQPLLTRQKIAQRMGVKLDTVTAWVKRGFIVPMEQKRNSMYFSRAEVKRFEHEFVSTEAAAGILQINELTVQSWTRKGRLHPVSGPGVDDRAAYLFHREEVERLRLENRCTAPEMSARLGISRSQLRMWIEQGKVKPISGPGIDQCGRYLFALDEMMDQ